MKARQTIKLAANLRKLLAVNNLTMSAAAKKFGINKSTLHNYCSGATPRNLIKLKDLADQLGVPFDELLFGQKPLPLTTKFTNDFEGKFEITIRRTSLAHRPAM